MSCRKNEAPAMGLFLFHALFVKSSDLGDLGDLGCQKPCPERRRPLQANAFRWVIWVIWVQCPKSLYIFNKNVSV